MSTEKKHLPAPLFFIVIRIPAWTPEQAERIEKEVRDKFTAHDVTREENPVPPVPVLEETTTAGGVTAPGALTVSTSHPDHGRSIELPPTVIPRKHVESFLAQLLADGVSESKIVHALGVFVLPKKPTAAAEPEKPKSDEPPPDFGPFTEGDTLEDKHVPDRIVIVAGVDSDGWTWTDKDGNTGANAWADAEHYRKVSAKKAAQIAKEILST